MRSSSGSGSPLLLMLITAAACGTLPPPEVGPAVASTSPNSAVFVTRPGTDTLAVERMETLPFIDMVHWPFEIALMRARDHARQTLDDAAGRSAGALSGRDTARAIRLQWDMEQRVVPLVVR